MTNITIDPTTKPDESQTFNRALVAARLANLTKSDAAALSHASANLHLQTPTRSEAKRNLDRLKRGCSQVWRGTKWWFYTVLDGCLYIGGACLFMVFVHWTAQAGGVIAGLF
jgi:hypothetical protein